MPEDIFGGRWGLSVFAGINFGFVPGANIGMVDVLLWTAEFGKRGSGGEVDARL